MPQHLTPAPTLTIQIRHRLTTRDLTDLAAYLRCRRGAAALASKPAFLADVRFLLAEHGAGGLEGWPDRLDPSEVAAAYREAEAKVATWFPERPTPSAARKPPDPSMG